MKNQKLTIVIEAPPKVISKIAVILSDGGGEQLLTPFEDEAPEFLKFNYSKCFPAWGYDPEKDGPDKLITVTVEKSE